jgi:hypothetical protein
MKPENKSRIEKFRAYIDSHSTLKMIYHLAIVSMCLYGLSMLFRLFALLFNNYNQMKIAYNGYTK